MHPHSSAIATNAGVVPKDTHLESLDCLQAELLAALRLASQENRADIFAVDVAHYDLGDCVSFDAINHVLTNAPECANESDNRPMIRQSSWRWVRWAIAGSLLPATCVSLQGALAQQQSGSAPSTAEYTPSRRSWYVGGGLGISRLDPDSFCRCITIDDENDLAFNLYAGIDLTKRFAIEAQFAELGQSDVAFLGEPVGGIDYRVAGVTGLLYLFDTSGFSGNRAQDGGVSFYVKAGGGILDNSSRLDFVQNNDTQFWIGAGIQLGFDNGWALRAELNSYDTDAQQVTASLVKRFAIGNRDTSNQNYAPAPIPVVDTPSIVEEVAPVAPVFTLTNADLPTVYFDFDHSDLDAPMRWKLHELAQQLQEDTEKKIVLSGHTDSLGSENYNSVLSMKRAAATRDYLLSQSVDAKRIEIVALGEAQPVASNQTDEGRALNRRVGITLAE